MPSDSGFLVDGVHFAYDGHEVLRGLSLSIPYGSLTALLGPNGSGKTTFLRLLSGSRKPDRGSVLLESRDVRAIPTSERARRISLVSQHVDAGLTFEVEAMVALGRTPHTGLFGSLSRHDWDSVAAALVATDTLDLAKRRFSELSGGEQRRVVLAMSLAQDTDYLLLDEPTLHLDVHHQHEFLELLQRLHTERGLTILAVMHDLNLSALYFQHLVVMDAGKIVAEGSPRDVFSNPEALRVFRAPLTVVDHPESDAPQVLLRRNPRD